MKNRKKFGRKSGGIILGYKDHLENYIEISSQNSGYCKRNFTPQKFKLRTFKLRSFLTVQFKLSSALLLLYELELCGEN
jgi:hypothetical protein